MQAAASDFSDNTEFEYVLTKVDTPDNPGNVEAKLFLKTDSEKLITTFGATIVLNLDYFDLVDKKGNVVTDAYKTDVKILENNMPLYASKIGKKSLKFSSVKGLTIASYNSGNNELYLFVCGMAISGIQIEQKSEVAYLYFNAKQDKVPANAFRVMKQSEVGTACKSQAVMVTQIGCTTEVGDSPSKISINADEALIDSSKEIPTEPISEDTSEPVQGDSTQPSTDSSSEEKVTKAVEDMSEQEIEKEIEQKIDIHDSINISEKQKQSPAYKAYEKAVEKAQKVLDDKNATKEEKAEALKELRDAEQTLKETVPEAAEQIEETEKELEARSSRSPWLFIGIGGGVAVLAAVIIVLIIKNRKKENS